jgi:hypothetical protein
VPLVYLDFINLAGYLRQTLGSTDPLGEPASRRLGRLQKSVSGEVPELESFV